MSDAKTDLPNPKQFYGDKKPPLDELPLSAMIHASLAHLDGDNKYGFRNWRDSPVEARTYIKGAIRHLRLFEEGEDYTRDSNVHNLGAVIAGCAILIDAQVNGTMIDNRRGSKAVCDLLHDAEELVAHLNELQRKRDAAKTAAAALSAPYTGGQSHAGDAYAYASMGPALYGDRGAMVDILWPGTGQVEKVWVPKGFSLVADRELAPGGEDYRPVSATYQDVDAMMVPDIADIEADTGPADEY